MQIFNNKFSRNYSVIESLEAGIELLGAEVKSIKLGRASIGDSYARIKGGQIFLINMYVSPYLGSKLDPTRERRLLLKKSEIQKLVGLASSGLTFVPKKVYTNHNLIKVEIAVVKGKKQFERREDLRREAIERDIDREVRGEKN